MELEENFNCHQFMIDGREFHEKRYQTHKNEISHFAIEMLSLRSNHIGACVPNKKIINHLLYLREKSTSVRSMGF